MCYCPTPTLHLNLALTGDCAFQLSPKKPHSVWFISVLKSGDMGQCPEKSPSPCNTCVIPVSLYKSMSWFVTKTRTHTTTHTLTLSLTHTHTHSLTHTHTHTHTGLRSALMTHCMKTLNNEWLIMCLNSMRASENSFMAECVGGTSGEIIFSSWKKTLIFLKTLFTSFSSH